MTALVALHRARAAWEATQPQMVIDGWAAMLDGLNEPHAGTVRPVEPAHADLPLAGGLQAGGTEPRHAPPEGADGFPRVADTDAPVSSVPPPQTTGPAALPSKSARQGQGG